MESLSKGFWKYFSFVSNLKAKTISQDIRCVFMSLISLTVKQLNIFESEQNTL